MKRNLLLQGLCVSMFFLSAITSFAQLTKRAATPIPNANSNGFLEWLPGGYDPAGTKRYPLIIYINGDGSDGDGSIGSVDTNGVRSGLERHFSGGGYPHEQQRNNNGADWVDEYTVNGQSYRFVIITPQFLTPWSTKAPTPAEINAVINYSILNYRIDTSRIYLLGQSQGAGAVWDYPGASSAYARRIAAIVPFAGVSFPLETRVNNIKYNNVAVWTFHNRYDGAVPAYFSIDYVDFINSPPTPAIPAKKTISALVNSTGEPDPVHNIWFSWLRRDSTDNNLDIYEWMLQYKRTVSRANAGDFQEINLPASSVQLNGSGTGPNGSASSYNWQKISGPAGGTLSNAAILNPTVTGLTEGIYVFRLTINDDSGGAATSEVTISVKPQPTRIQAEAWTTMSGVTNETTQDVGGGQNVGNIEFQDFMNYSINIPETGNYKFRFRFASIHSDGRFRIKTASGTVLDTIEVFRTGGWQSYLTRTVIIPFAAGQQDIQLESISANGWNINWFEFERQSGSQVVLPVNFVLFNANCNATGGVDLLWKINASVNSRNFSIEKSMDGRTWNEIGSIPSNTQNTFEQTFNFTDPNPGNGKFYRIVEYGLDGRKTISTVVKNNCNVKTSVTVFPNPVEDKAVVNVTLEAGSKVQIAVIDNKGSVIRQQESFLPQGSSQLSIDMGGVAKGVYTLRAAWGNEVKSIKLIKK